MYIQRKFNDHIFAVTQIELGLTIPFDTANTDYQTFKREVAVGTPLEDPEGNVMTQEQVDEFLKEIP